ncbi:hypothetical protein D6D17_06776 [Aureobasidium pullulans]|nr:hypothetical protein E4T52_16757 [Aureobasidium sp. EXF-3400]THW98306.1 hypothetical protein D6D17_06776 [Aureobasidium pullulans]TIA09399.1 hypothetical protein D6C81_08731 [Aureobasidium pullulans]
MRFSKPANVLIIQNFDESSPLAESRQLCLPSVVEPTRSGIHHYPKGTGSDLHEYPKGTGEDLHECTAPPGGWGSVDYSKGSAATPAKYPEAVSSPSKLTSYYGVKATPDQIVNGTTPTGDFADTSSLFKVGIGSELNLICYNFEIYKFHGEYQSPAASATQIHEAAKGASGSPRIALPNLIYVGNGVRRSVGCQQSPFKTGLLANGKDTADGLHISLIEKNPAGIFADTQSSFAVPGAVRG